MEKFDLYREFVGTENHQYYWERIERYLRNGSSSMGFDWKAAVLGFWWFAYLKVWNIVGPYALILLGGQYLIEPSEFRILALALFLVERVVGGIWGVRIYGWWVRREVDQIVRQAPTEEEALKRVRERGGTMGETVLTGSR